jgi:hypothetical protein
MALISQPAFGTTVLVDPADMGTWAFANSDVNRTVGNNTTGVGQMVTGPATPPLGSGSANLATGNGAAGGDGAEILSNTAYAGVALSSLTALSYSTYDTVNNGQQFPYLQLEISYLSGGSSCSSNRPSNTFERQPEPARSGCFAPERVAELECPDWRLVGQPRHLRQPRSWHAWRRVPCYLHQRPSGRYDCQYFWNGRSSRRNWRGSARGGVRKPDRSVQRLCRCLHDRRQRRRYNVQLRSEPHVVCARARNAPTA